MTNRAWISRLGMIASKHPVLMSPKAQVVQFAQFVVTTQVFYATKLSAALVNLKPILPGHSLVIPKRVVPRYTDLSPDEVHFYIRFNSR